MRELSRILWASSGMLYGTAVLVIAEYLVTEMLANLCSTNSDLSHKGLCSDLIEITAKVTLQWHVWWGHFPTQNSPIVFLWVCNRGLTSSAYDTMLSLLSLHLLLVFHPETEPWTHLCQSKLLGRKWQDWLSEKRGYMVHVTVKISIY